MKAIWGAAGIAILSLTLSHSALALGQPNYSPDDQTVCQPDVFRLCNDAVPDEGKIVLCMKAKRKDLSPECRKVFDSGLKKRPK